MGDLRRLYIAALHAADGHDIGPFLAFARSQASDATMLLRKAGQGL
jgi:hypothetical protein